MGILKAKKVLVRKNIFLLLILLAFLTLSLIVVKNSQIITGRAANLLRPCGKDLGQSCCPYPDSSSELVEKLYCSGSYACYQQLNYNSANKYFSNDKNSNADSCYIAKDVPLDPQKINYTLRSVCGKGPGTPCCPEDDLRGKCGSMEGRTEICSDGPDLQTPTLNNINQYSKIANPWYYLDADGRPVDAGDSENRVSKGICLPLELVKNQQTCGGSGEICCGTPRECDDPGLVCTTEDILSYFEVRKLGEYKCRLLNPESVKFRIRFFPNVNDLYFDNFSETDTTSDKVNSFSTVQNSYVAFTAENNLSRRYLFGGVDYQLNVACDYHQPTDFIPVTDFTKYPHCGPYTELRNYTLAIQLTPIILALPPVNFSFTVKVTKPGSITGPSRN